MDGLDAGSALLEAQPSFPIFLMSGYSKDGVAASRHMSRFFGYLAKPFGLSVIRTALQHRTTRSIRTWFRDLGYVAVRLVRPPQPGCRSQLA